MRWCGEGKTKLCTHRLHYALYSSTQARKTGTGAPVAMQCFLQVRCRCAAGALPHQLWVAVHICLASSRRGTVADVPLLLSTRWQAPLLPIPTHTPTQQPCCSPLCSCHCCFTSPLLASHRMAVRSTLPDSRQVPFLFHLRLKMGPVCFLSTRTSSPAARGVTGQGA